MSEGDFTKKVMLLAWKAAKGHCNQCHSYLGGKIPHYDHIRPKSMGGTNDLTNCQVLCQSCHAVKTGGEAPLRAKADRAGRRAAGIPQKKRAMPGSRASGWKRLMNGIMVRREK